MTVFTFRRWLQESSRLTRNSWPTWESRIWKSASNPCTLWTTPFWGRGNYLGNWAYSVDSPSWLVWLSAGFWKVSQGFALLLPLKRVERISPLNIIGSWRHSVVHYLSEKCAALCLELTSVKSWFLSFTLLFPLFQTFKAPSQKTVFISTTVRMEQRIQMLPWKSSEMLLLSVFSPRLVKVTPFMNVLHASVCVRAHDRRSSLIWGCLSHLCVIRK